VLCLPLAKTSFGYVLIVSLIYDGDNRLEIYNISTNNVHLLPAFSKLNLFLLDAHHKMDSLLNKATVHQIGTKTVQLFP